jgi:uncharacterized repeat protein (TIGR03943 family)
LALAAFLVHQALSGTLLLYISHRFAWLIWPAALALLAMGLARLIRPDGAAGCDHACHDHDHSHGPSAIGLLLVALPVLLGLLVPPRPLGTAALSGRPTSPIVADTLSAARPALPPEQNTILDWALAFEESAGHEHVGLPARVTGMVYRDERYGDDAFLAVRFVISCCAADAYPVVMAVQWPGAHELANDDWVEVRGRIRVAAFLGHETPLLVAEAVRPIEPPREPYLYP